MDDMTDTLSVDFSPTWCASVDPAVMDDMTDTFSIDVSTPRYAGIDAIDLLHSNDDITALAWLTAGIKARERTAPKLGVTLFTVE
jgi:hypothetical protein